MTTRDLTSVSLLLPRALAQLARDSGDATALRSVWDRALGPVIARHSTPVSFRDGVLIIAVTSVRWKSELEQRESELKCRLADYLGGVQLTQLQFRLA